MRWVKNKKLFQEIKIQYTINKGMLNEAKFNKTL